MLRMVRGQAGAWPRPISSRALDGAQTPYSSEMRRMEIVLQDIQVIYVSAEGGPAGAHAAFDRLESFLPSLRGRKFYGTFHGGEYRACVAQEDQDSPADWGLPTWTIPGGPYAREKLKNWPEHVSEIGTVFDQLAQEHPGDPDRPRVEYYRSQDELHLLLPILKS
jgi:hypothetical protein